MKNIVRNFHTDEVIGVVTSESLHVRNCIDVQLMEGGTFVLTEGDVDVSRSVWQITAEDNDGTEEAREAIRIVGNLDDADLLVKQLNHGRYCAYYFSRRNVQ